MRNPRIMCESRNIERNPLNREIMVHSAMYYKCKVCGTIFQFWLEKGLEDRKQDEINPQNHKPVPFCIGCLCGGIAQHFAWGSDIRLDDYRPLGEDENYFENTEDSDCGVSHFRNEGNIKIVKQEFPDISEFVKLIATEHEERKKVREQDFRGDFEDDPYRLAYVSTSTLKAELRRRKRWK